jgi:hypothetical protein
MANNAVELNGSAESYIRVEDLAKILDVKPRTILDWSHRYPDFPMLRTPGMIRVRATEVSEWLRRITVESRAANQNHAKTV